MTPGPTEHAVALVDRGAFGTFVLDAIRDIPSLRVAACADADRRQAQTLAARYGAAVHARVRDVTALPDVNVVVPATPPAAHADAAVAALRAGKHVFCEKPMARTVEDAARVEAASRPSQGAFVVDHVLRHNPVLRLLQRLGQEEPPDPLRRFTFENDASDEHPARTTGSGTRHTAAASTSSTACTSSTPPTL